MLCCSGLLLASRYAAGRAPSGLQPNGSTTNHMGLALTLSRSLQLARTSRKTAGGWQEGGLASQCWRPGLAVPTMQWFASRKTSFSNETVHRRPVSGSLPAAGRRCNSKLRTRPCKKSKAIFTLHSLETLIVLMIICCGFEHPSWHEMMTATYASCLLQVSCCCRQM